MLTNAELYAFMHARRLGVLASTAADGTPEAAVVGYAVTSDVELIFDTTEASRKCQNLRRDGRIAFAIGWDGEITVQYEGIADEPVGEELGRSKAVYFETYPEGVARQAWPGITYFRVRPRWIRYSDFNEPQRIDER
jgi:pyridoxine/pyridoxamine 5'-phosphate oxidase